MTTELSGRHRLKVVLLQPQIAPNTGNIGRLCAATGAELHLVRPLGFVIGDRQLRRSGMDYWQDVKLTLHENTAAFFQWLGSSRAWLLSSGGARSLWEAQFADADVLVFGNETRGVSQEVRDRFGSNNLRIPQVAGARCLNLSTAAGVALYEALRQVHGG